MPIDFSDPIDFDKLQELYKAAVEGGEEPSCIVMEGTPEEIEARLQFLSEYLGIEGHVESFISVRGGL